MSRTVDFGMKQDAHEREARAGAMHTTGHAPGRPATPLRLLLLALLLLAFARLTWQLGDKGLWWDESLSLQRAEQSLVPLVVGYLIMFDGIDWQVTIDQHPFFFFLLQGVMIRAAGDSEFALRFVSVMAATLLVPAVWMFCRALARRGALPGATPVFAALLTSVSPFFLWYGQEARPYALWALLAVLSTYWLYQVTLAPVSSAPRRAHWFAYIATLLAFLATHYYAVFLLPLHAVAWFVRLYGKRPKTAVAAAAGLLAGGAALSGAAYYRIIIMQGGGGNFPSIRLGILVPDLLNAFSMGLSVDINRVWWLDLIFGAVALVGLVWLLWRPARMIRGGWLPVLMVLVPVGAVLVLNIFTPAYMNARHLSLIGGGYLMVLGAGLAAIWQARLWARVPFSMAFAVAALVLAALFTAGAGYSTRNYFTEEEYTHDDLTAVGRHLAGRLAEGDLILLNPPFSWRIFDYYLPFEGVDAAIAQDAHLRRLGVPRLGDSWDAREAELAALIPQYRRIWYVVLGTHPYLDLENRTDAWLDAQLYPVQSRQYFSHSRLSVTQYLPDVPVTWDDPEIQEPHALIFGDQIRLAGFDVGATLYDGLALPVTLYWQTLDETDRRYKYILRLVAVDDAQHTPQDEAQAAGEQTEAGQETSAPHITQVLSLTEREPYDGAIPTIYWAPGQTIIEMTELPPHDWDALRANPEGYALAVEVYDDETLEKLPVTQAAGNAQAGGEVGFLPFAPR